MSGYKACVTQRIIISVDILYRITEIEHFIKEQLKKSDHSKEKKNSLKRKKEIVVKLKIILIFQRETDTNDKIFILINNVCRFKF